MKNEPVYLNHLGLICALGSDHKSISNKLFTGYSDNLIQTSEFSEKSVYLGKVSESLPALEEFPTVERTRNNQLLKAAFNQIKATLTSDYGHIKKERIGIVIGTSTSGIAEGEKALAEQIKTGDLPEGFDYSMQEMSAPATALAGWVGSKGPCYVISTACSSSAKALASARRLIRSGICDLVIAGGVDSLAGLTVNGFAALDSVSKGICNPYSASRDGINIGEGAALFMVSNKDLTTNQTPAISLAGIGECSDAHHISAPEPEGKGAEQAMQLAMSNANISKQDIGYINMHGTATIQNDRMEGRAIYRLFKDSVPCSSTKGYTGHTLGAAGAIEAAFCWLLLANDNPHKMPVHLSDHAIDPELEPISLVKDNTDNQPIKYAMSNSFAFGGNNISLILERRS